MSAFDSLAYASPRELARTTDRLKAADKRADSHTQVQATEETCRICKLSPSAPRAPDWYQRDSWMSEEKTPYFTLSPSELGEVCRPCYVRRAATVEYLRHLAAGETAWSIFHTWLGISVNTRTSQGTDVGHTLELACNTRASILSDALLDLRPHVSGITSDQAALRWIRDRLAACKAHPSCCSPYSIRQVKDMPQYLLHLSSINLHRPELSMVRIIETSQIVRYICLSYCWGQSSSNNLTLKRATKHEYSTAGIAWEHLPLAFRDAVTLIANLGYSYLWIDALCIVQDDAKQRQHQIERMEIIYSNCDLVIANLHAKDPHEGLFHSAETDRAVGHPIEQLSSIGNTVSVRNMLPHPKYAIHTVAFFRTQAKNQQTEFLPLMTRAWTLQELVLAPRVLFFDRWEVLWECGETMTCQCECPLFSQQAWSGVSAIKDVFGDRQPGTLLIRKMLRAPCSLKDMLQLWISLVKAYARRRITFDTDRYDAFMGIAGKVAAKIGDDPVAGMLRYDLHACLSWITLHGSELYPGPSPASWPSWSWLSIVGTEGAEINSAFDKVADFQACTQSYIVPGIEAGRHVLYMGANLYLLPIKYEPIKPTQGSRAPTHAKADFDEDTFFGSSMDPDDRDKRYTLRFDARVQRTKALHCMELGREWKEGDTKMTTIFLLLSPADNTLLRFRREGILLTWMDAGWRKHPDVKPTTFTVI